MVNAEVVSDPACYWLNLSHFRCNCNCETAAAGTRNGASIGLNGLNAAFESVLKAPACRAACQPFKPSELPDTFAFIVSDSAVAVALACCILLEAIAA